MASASKKQKTQAPQAGGDRKVAVTSDGIDQEDWARAGWAADEVVQRARAYVRRTFSDDSFAQPISKEITTVEPYKRPRSIGSHFAPHSRHIDPKGSSGGQPEGPLGSMCLELSSRGTFGVYVS